MDEDEEAEEIDKSGHDSELFSTLGNEKEFIFFLYSSLLILSLTVFILSNNNLSSSIISEALFTSSEFGENNEVAKKTLRKNKKII
jgi:hypothetical protein